MMNSNKENIEILLMQPINMPRKLLSALSCYFRNDRNIEKAYFATAQFSNSLDSMDWIIAITAKNNIENELVKIKNYLLKNDVDTDGKRVAIVNVNQNRFSEYFLKIQPFYNKK